ncbi:MAG: tol-pal system protein YbgF [Thermoanaerobaculia bacterium]|nr:tol-pal system protein YbgF [Thermoanaerobaculia bacterium]
MRIAFRRILRESWFPASMAWLVVWGGAGLLAPAPARADNADDEVQQLRARVVELRRELVMRDLEIQRLAEELTELRAQLASGPSEHGGGVVGGAEEPTTINDDVALRGLGGVEEFELEEPDPPPIAPSPPAQSTPTEVQTEAGDSTGGEKLYDQGYALFHQQQYPEAERAFRLFLSRYPASDLADNAYFWIGESRWARGDFAAALESYTTTVEQYPDGNKIPDALLKAGRCLEALGQTARAVRTYEEVVLRFAGSAAAITAQERLDQLR